MTEPKQITLDGKCALIFAQEDNDLHISIVAGDKATEEMIEFTKAAAMLLQTAAESAIAAAFQVKNTEVI